MSKIIKLTRIKRETNNKLVEFDIWVNTKYIMGFRKSTDNEIGNSRVDIYFPDTVRAYMVLETPNIIEDRINGIDDLEKEYETATEEDYFSDDNPFDLEEEGDV